MKKDIIGFLVLVAVVSMIGFVLYLWYGDAEGQGIPTPKLIVDFDPERLEGIRTAVPMLYPDLPDSAAQALIGQMVIARTQQTYKSFVVEMVEAFVLVDSVQAVALMKEHYVSLQYPYGGIIGYRGEE